MYLPQIALSLVVLVCVLLQFEVALVSSAPLTCNKILLSSHPVVQRTGQDARKAASLAKRYLGSCQQIQGMIPGNVTECGGIINFTSPDETLQGTANAFINLNKLLYMFWFVRKDTELSGNAFTESDSAKLDLLEIAFTQLSNQVEWYLQIHPCSCNGTRCAVEEGIDKIRIREEIQNMQSESCTNIKSLNVIVQELWSAAGYIARSLPDGDSGSAYPWKPYKLCPTVAVLRNFCETTVKENCNPSG